MPRRRKHHIHGGKEITGVSYHPDGGFYIILPGNKRQYYGKGDAAMWRAKVVYDALSCPIPVQVPALSNQDAARELLERLEPHEEQLRDFDPEQTLCDWQNAGDAATRRDILIRLGVPAKHLAENPDELFSELGGFRKVNPEWAAANGPEKVMDFKMPRWLGITRDEWEQRKAKTQLEARRAVEGSLSVSEIGQVYLTWYVTDKKGYEIAALEKELVAVRAGLAAELAAEQAKLEQNDSSARRRADIAALQSRLKRIKWVDLLDRTARQAYREQDKYFGEFVTFIKLRHGHDSAVVQLTGDDIRAYYDHVATASRRRKRVANRDKWRNSRYKAVITAFRRAKKKYPDAKWPVGFFGEDGILKILECRGTVTEAQKVLLTPAEFKALLELADAQWRAILLLSLNAALENESISKICWCHIDWQRKLMLFPRPKNGRLRQTPLADETLAALRQWRAESRGAGPNIFVTPHGGEWVDGTDSLGKHFNLLKKKVKETTGAVIPGTFKSLRKTASSTVMQATRDERAVDMLLGHAPNKSWRHYVGFAPDYLHDAVRSVASNFFAVLSSRTVRNVV